MKCKIFRDFDTNEVTHVINSDGNKSQIFSEALSQLRNEDAALDVWGVTQLPEFQVYASNIPKVNGEISLKDVHNFINNMNTSEGLSEYDVVELSTILQNNNIESPDYLLAKLEGAFYNNEGNFVISKSKLRESGLYSELEVNNLMMSPTARTQVKFFMNRLRNTLQGFNTLQESFFDNPTQKPFVISNTEVTTSYGKFPSYSWQESRDYLVENIGEVSTETQFRTAVDNLSNEVYKNAILDNSDTYNQVYAFMQTVKSVPVFNEIEGDYLSKLKTDKAVTMLQTLRVGEPTYTFTMAGVDVARFPESNWYANPAIQPLLKNLETVAATHQIDIVGLADSFNTKSRDEIIDFIEEVSNFLEAAENNEVGTPEILYIDGVISSFLGGDTSQQMETIEVSPSDKQRNLISVDTSSNELSTFSELGGVKVRDSLYQKVTPYATFNEMLEEVYNGLTEDVTILSDALLKKIGIINDNGTYNIGKLNDPRFKSNVQLALSNHINSVVANDYMTDTIEEFQLSSQIALYKELLKINDVRATQPDLGAISARKALSSLDESQLEYLTSNFISDFYTYTLMEKVDNTPLYQTALRYFDITNKGIVTTTNDIGVQKQILQIMKGDDMFELLQAYSALSKDASMEYLIPETLTPTIIDVQIRRDAAVNHPESVLKLKGPSTRVDENNILVKNSTEEFIRLGDGIYELTDFKEGVGVYTKLNYPVDNNFYVFNHAEPISITDDNVNDYIQYGVEGKTENLTKVTNRATEDLIEMRKC